MTYGCFPDCFHDFLVVLKEQEHPALAPKVGATSPSVAKEIETACREGKENLGGLPFACREGKENLGGLQLLAGKEKKTSEVFSCLPASNSRAAVAKLVPP